MLKLDNPLKMLGFKTDDIIEKGEFGAILARAGIGKTSVIVQLAIFAMTQGKKVLHISLDEPVNKVNVWYRETFNNLSEKNKIETSSAAWESLLPNRFIMTLRLDGFSIPRLEERLTDLAEQDILTPETIIIDGFPFDNADRKTLEDLKVFAAKKGVNVWFTIRTHRHEAPDENGLPIQLTNISDLFETAIQILPEDDKIKLKVLIGESDTSKQLYVDTNTMLISE